MKYILHQLDNGIRTVFRHTDSEVAHVGLIIGVGSRDEEKDESGLAHFIEHTVFKGTKKRKAFHILSYLENVGGELNAFTSREETCIYASVPVKFIERALELLADVFTNSVFPEKEISREKDVVIEEIQYYRDLPDETIMDDFEEMVFKGHPIGRNILGSPKHIKTFNGEKIRKFISNNYCNDKTIISCVGGIDENHWFRLADRFFSSVDNKGTGKKRKAFNNYKPFEKTVVKKTHQTHCVIGATAYPYYDEKRPGLVLLNNILGGPCNNSRLNLAIRERHGLSYNIESNYNTYSDTGIITVYMGVENGSYTRALALTRKEMSKLCDTRLGTLQFHRAQQQIIGQIAMAHESKLGDMLSMGKSMLIHGKVDTLEEINQKIMKLTADRLQEIAQEIFDDTRISTLIYSS